MTIRAIRLALLAALALASPAAAQDVDAERIYGTDCAWCHGGDGRGSNNGPSLVGVGAASAHFYLTTGRMPLDEPRVPERTAPAYTDEQIAALVDLVAGFGEGPAVPEVEVGEANVVRGGELYRIHCAACHGFSGWGGAIVFRRHPTPLTAATPTQVVEAMLIGLPGMPVFGDDTLSDAERRDVAAYVTRVLQGAPASHGGHPIGRAGPVPEGLVAWLVGFAILFLVARALGERRPPQEGE